jgi:hypothetical protein
MKKAAKSSSTLKLPVALLSYSYKLVQLSIVDPQESMSPEKGYIFRRWIAPWPLAKLHDRVESQQCIYAFERERERCSISDSWDWSW